MPAPPTIDGVSASRFQLPPGPWPRILDALCACFPRIGRDHWVSRFARGRVLDAAGVALDIDAPYRVGAEIHYYREVVDEPRLAAEENILHVDAHLIVVDKPHGLPVVPGGGHVAETLLARLVRRFGDVGIAPLHRLDRLTAGLVLFSANVDTRARYQALFRDRAIGKRYEALAPPLPALAFPHERRTRLVRGEPFFRMRETTGEANTLTRIDVIERGDDVWRYALEPVTGRKHQLRVHMAALGAPILGDPLYPMLRDAGLLDAGLLDAGLLDAGLLDAGDDAPESSLQLLARSLAFVDPLDGRRRAFESGLSLRM